MNNPSAWKTIFGAIFLFIAGMTAQYFIANITGCKKVSEPVIVINDSTTQARADYQVSKDTSTSLLEIPFKTHLKPITVYQQKAKGNYVAETNKKDLVTSMKATKSELSVFAFNNSDSLIKEYKFDNPGRQFSLVTQNGNIYVKSYDWYWRTLMLTGGITTTADNYDWQNVNKKVGLKTRLEWKDRIELEASVKHNLTEAPALKNLELNIELNYTLIK